jgi:hypothetical protein
MDSQTPRPNLAYVATVLLQALWRSSPLGAKSRRRTSLRDIRKHLLPTPHERDRRRRADLPYLAVGTLMLNEGPNLEEWIEFHRAQGVERFYLYDNGSNDDTREVLAPYIAAGVVELTDWPERGAQGGAFRDCLRRHRDDVRWLAFIDIDEFLYASTRERVVDVLTEFECYPAVGVHWLAFGTSGVSEPAPRVLPVFTRRLDDFGPQSVNKIIKSIVDPRCVLADHPASSHHWHYRVGLAVDEVGRPLAGPVPWPIRCSRLRINHYWTKSESEAAAKASGRHTAFDNYLPLSLEQLTDPSLNAVEDRTILDVSTNLQAGRVSPPQPSVSTLLALFDTARFIGLLGFWFSRYTVPELVRRFGTRLKTALG